MAFNALKGEKIHVSQTAHTFIFGDYFSVFENDGEIPRVYEWNSVKSCTERLSEVTFVMNDGETYVIPKNAFADNEQMIRCRTIAEGQMSAEVCRLGQRIIPPKYNYCGTQMPALSYSASGFYSEKDINPGSAANIHTKTAKFLWLIAGVVCAAVFVCLNIFVGELVKNWYYYAPISLFSGIGAAVIVYVILGIISKFRYSDFVKYDVSATEEIVLVVAKEGFAAVERCVYTGTELIPWTHASYQFQTKSTIVIVCKDGFACWIPKRMFPKEVQGEIASFIASRAQAK